MKPPAEWKIPEFMAELPDTASLNTREICSIFGCSMGSIVRHARKQQGHLLSSVPPCDGALLNQGHLGKSVYRWRLGTIRKWIKDHQ